MVDSKYKVGDVIQFRSSQPMRHLNEMFCRGVDSEEVDEYIGVINDVSFFFMDGDSAVYTYDATTTRSPFEDFECSFNCMLLDSDILRVLKEDEWTEAEHYCQRKYCQNDS